MISNILNEYFILEIYSCFISFKSDDIEDNISLLYSLEFSLLFSIYLIFSKSDCLISDIFCLCKLSSYSSSLSLKLLSYFLLFFCFCDCIIFVFFNLSFIFLSLISSFLNIVKFLFSFLLLYICIPSKFKSEFNSLVLQNSIGLLFLL